MFCSKRASKQEAAEIHFLPESGRKIAAAAIAAGVQVEAAVKPILQDMKHELNEQGRNSPVNMQAFPVW